MNVREDRASTTRARSIMLSMFSPRPRDQPTAGDALIYEAIAELECAGTAEGRRPGQQRGLERLLGRMDGAALSHGFYAWRQAAACWPLEDELYSSKKALARAHSNLKAAVAAQHR